MNSSLSHLRLLSFGRHLPHIRQSPSVNRCANRRTLFGFGRKKKSEVIETPVVNEIEQKYTEEEVLRMRDVSRLPGLVRTQLTGKNIQPIGFLWQMGTQQIRKRYAMYGRASGLKPGVMWPSKEELEYQIGYEKAFCKPFYQLVEELNEKKRSEAKKIKDREEQVLAKLEELPKYKKEFWQKYHQMHAQKQEESSKKERLIQEVREFVGYDLDPNDPRFEEALLKKDEEQKKIQKALRKQEKQKATLERLQALANEAMEKEKQEQTLVDKSKTQTKSDNKSIDENK